MFPKPFKPEELHKKIMYYTSTPGFLEHRQACIKEMRKERSLRIFIASKQLLLICFFKLLDI